MKKLLLCLLLILALTSLFACDSRPQDSQPNTDYTGGYAEDHTGKPTEKPTEKPAEKPTEAHQCEYSLTESKASTCATQGYNIYTCACGSAYTDHLPLSDTHTFGEYASDGNATCLSDGTKTAKCEYCEVISTVADEGSAKPHVFESYVSDGNATCLSDGTKTAVCKTCSTETHTVTDEGSKLTCTVETWISYDGISTVGKCKRCGAEKRGELPEDEHELSNIVCNPDGSEMRYVCSDCNVGFLIDNVLSITVTRSEHTEGFCLEVSSTIPSLTFSSTDLLSIPLKLNVTCEGFGDKNTILDFGSSVTEISFGENVNVLKDIFGFEYTQRISADDCLGLIKTNCFFDSVSLTELYLEGDCPTLEKNALFRALRVLGDDDAPHEFNPTLYYKEGARGYEGYKLQGFTLAQIGAAAPVAPHDSIAQYSSDTASKALLMADTFFDGFKASGNSLHLMPMCSFEKYAEIYTLAHTLTDGLESETDKARAIFDWITENLTYDEAARYYSVDKVFEERIAVCNGYVILMHDMLSAVGISSLYTHGIVTYTEGLTIGDILDGSNYEKYDGDHHAWILCCLDGETVICDPTWTEFDISAETLALTRMTLAIYGVDVIPDNFDPRLYANINYYDDGGLYHLNYGKLSTSTGVEMVFNFSFSKYYRFYVPNDGYEFLGEAPELYSAYSNVFAEYCDMGYRLRIYVDSAFNEHPYITVLKYLNFHRLQEGDEISEEILDEFVFDENGNIYLILNDKELEFIGTVFEGETLMLPAEVGGRSVVGIGWGAFMDCRASQILLPDSVTYIQSTAFWGCVNLTELTLPKNLKKLGVSVFSFCHNLERLVLPASVEFIGLPDNKNSCLPYEMFAELSPETLTVVYEGTKEQFDGINFYTPWESEEDGYFDRFQYEHMLEFVKFGE